jgi:hypothetical protein
MIDFPARISETGDGAVYLIIFGGQPNEHGTHPRRASIIADDADEGFTVSLSTFGRSVDDVCFDVTPSEAAAALRRIAAFLHGS